MDKFLKKQDKHLQDLELLALRRILRNLMATRVQLIDLIMSTDGFDQTSSLATLQTVDRLIEELRLNLGQDFTDMVKEASRTGVHHQVDLIDKYFNAPMAKSVEMALYGSTELTVLKTLEMNVNDFLLRFSFQIRERVKNVIQQGFIHGRSQGEVILQIKDQFKTLTASTYRAVHHIYQTSYNAANQEVLVELQESIPGVKKQVIAWLDSRTTQICQGMDGQIKNVEEAFIDPHSGSEFMYPPFVWGNSDLTPPFHFCRSRAIPYIEGQNG